ncbi:hypothetical protein U1Q18_015471, partial [Sarracenia purpurea var. burkii]
NAPKTSEYAFFKKLKKESGCCRSYTSDKEDNHLKSFELNGGSRGNSISPLVKAVEDEAVEEDDNEEDCEELNDLIATEYDERPVDNEWRNELHQKWLEQWMQ